MTFGLSYRKGGLYYLLHNILPSFSVLSGTPFSRMLNHIYWSSHFLISPIFFLLFHFLRDLLHLPIILLKFIFLMSKSSFLLQNCIFFHSILFLFYDHKKLLSGSFLYTVYIFLHTCLTATNSSHSALIPLCNMTFLLLPSRNGMHPLLNLG